MCVSYCFKWNVLGVAVAMTGWPGFTGEVTADVNCCKAKFALI